MLKKNFGILTVEEVSEGFMQLVENCGNGAVVIVFKVFLISLESSKSYKCIYPSGCPTNGISRLQSSSCIWDGLLGSGLE